LYLFDTFEGFGTRNVAEEETTTGQSIHSAQFSDTSESLVVSAIQPVNDNVRLIKGFFPDSFSGSLTELQFAFVHLDADLYGPTKAGLDLFYPRLAWGGMIVVHDYNAWAGARMAVEDFCNEHPDLLIVPMPDKSGSCVFRKTARDS
jgi:O-methyltransferase